MTDRTSSLVIPIAHVFEDDSGLSHEEVLTDLADLGFVVPQALGRLVQAVEDGVATAKQAKLRQARQRLNLRQRTRQETPTSTFLDREALIRGIRSFGQQALAFHRKLNIERMSDSELASLLEDLRAVNTAEEGDE